MEELKQQVTDTAKKIEKYDGRLKQYRENMQVQNNLLLFYTSLGENAEQNKLGPCKDDALKFWKEIWESPIRHNKDASQIKYICKETQGKHMNDVVITSEMIKRQIKAVKTWGAPCLLYTSPSPRD